MTTNKLKLNPNKTEFLLIGHELQRLKYLSMFPVTLLGSETHPSKTVRNLGVVSDENFNFRTHLNNACKLSYYHNHPRPAQNQKTFEPGPSQVPSVCSCVQSA